jgi:hypothetical protein
MENQDNRDLRDRLIRLEEQMKVTMASQAGLDRKLWAVVALVFVAVGKRLLDIIGLAP